MKTEEKTQEQEAGPSSSSTSLEKPANGVRVQHATTIDDLVAMAVEGNYPLDKLQTLIDMRDAERAKVAKREFDIALTSFQAEVPEIIKSKSGWDNKYVYAGLDDIERAIKPTKAKHGFSHKFKYGQVADEAGKMKIRVTCVLSHIGGHSEETTLEGYPDESVNRDGKATKNPIQAGGSSVTYLERYTLKGALGLTTTQTDTDGRAKKTREPEGKQEAPIDTEGLVSEKNLPPPTKEMFEKLKARVKSDGRPAIELAVSKLMLTPKLIRELLDLLPRAQPQKA